MNNVGKTLLSAAVTAGAVYFFDPASGRRRRILLRDSCARAARSVDLGTRDARSELSAVAGRAKNHFTQPTGDKAINKHAHWALSRTVSHPEAVDCTVRGGHVYLRGDVYAHELQRALDEIRRIPGVLIITDHLTPREAGEGIRPLTKGTNGRRDGWSVAGRLFAGAAGCALLVWGVRERKAIGAFGASVGESLAESWRNASKMDAEQRFENVADAIEKGLDAAERVGRGAKATVDESREAFRESQARAAH